MNRLISLLTAGALALVLAGCIGELPTPLGTATITVTPAEASVDGWSWQITGDADGNSFEYPADDPATCFPAPGVNCLIDTPVQVSVRMGLDWTLVFDPYTAAGDTPAWTGTGPSEEVSTAFVTDFGIPSIGSETDVEVTLRRTHELRAEAEYSAPGDPVALTLHDARVGSTETPFEVAEITASCVTSTGAVRTTHFAVTDSFSVSDTPGTVSLDYSSGASSFSSDTIVCSYAGHDTENRPISFHIVPLAD